MQVRWRPFVSGIQTLSQLPQFWESCRGSMHFPTLSQNLVFDGSTSDSHSGSFGPKRLPLDEALPDVELPGGTLQPSFASLQASVQQTEPHVL